MEKNELENIINGELHKLGIPTRLKGHQYLRTAILLTAQESDLILAVEESLYPAVAKEYCTTPSRVERAIRYAIDVSWERGDADALFSYFGYSLVEPKAPTNKEFIAMIADNIRLKYRIK